MKKSEYRIIFMGTPELAANIFSSLIDEGYKFVALIAQPDRPFGRKHELMPVPTKVVANNHNIPCFQPEKIRLDYEFVKGLKPDLILTLAYGQIIPQGLLDIPRLGCINIHGSLLPKLRGAAPLQYAFINGLQKTGFTLMEMIGKMDAGRMYAKLELDINENENYTSFVKRITPTLINFIKENLPLYLEGKLIGVSQNENEVTLAKMIKSENEHLDLLLSGQEIVNWIRGLGDEPGGYLLNEDEKIKIFRAKYEKIDFPQGQIGEIIQADKNGLKMKVKDGVISILELQKAGKKRLFYKDFLNGDKTILHKVLK